MKNKKTKVTMMLMVLMFVVIISSTLAIYKEVKNNKIKLNIFSPKYTVTFDANGGSVSTVSKEVTYESAYGELPTPTREGYTFLGWNGKNLFDKSSIKVIKNEVTLNDDKIYFDGSGTEENTANLLALQFYLDDTPVNVAYCHDSSIGFKSCTFQKKSTFNVLRMKLDTNKSDAVFEFLKDELEDNKTYTVSYNIDYFSSSEVKATISNFQVEEGDATTTYEPYYITSDTTVVQAKNHTLTAIWEKNKEATFLPGSEFNAKIKQLANQGESNITVNTKDENITSIQRYTSKPTEQILENSEIVSTDDSEYPIYAWFDDGTVYYYTEALNPYMNEDGSNMFVALTNALSIDLDTVDTSKTTNMSDMFNLCHNIETLDVSGFVTSNVTSMYAMFANMTKLKTIDVSNFDTTIVQKISAMFFKCESLTAIDVSNFVTSNVVTMWSMFYSCDSLVELDLSSFNMSKVTNVNDMLTNMASIKKLKTPNTYPSSLEIILPKTLYDESTNEYTKLVSTSPKQAWLRDAFTITYDCNGGTNQPANQTVIYGQTFTVTTDECTKTGYTFNGWQDSLANPGWTNYSGTWNFDNGDYGIENNILTLYARWTPNIYNVYYNGHGGTQLQSSDLIAKYDGLYHYFIESNGVNSWRNLSLNTYNKSVHNGVIYNGTWGEDYLEFNGTSTWVNLGEINSDYNTLEVTFSTDSTEKQHILGNLESGGNGIIISEGKIKAQYAINSYDSGYQVVNSKINVEVGKKYHVVSTYDGTTLKLYVDGVLTNSIEVSGTIYKPDDSTVMVIGANPDGSTATQDYFKGKIYNAAIYKSALTEEQIKNDSLKTVTYDESYGDLPTAARKGYTFNGWYTAITDGEKVESTTKVTTASDHNLYARWTPKTYTVTYDCDGGTGTPDDQTVEFYTEFSTSTTECSKEGYTFKGWYDTTDESWTSWTGRWTYDNGQYGIENNTLTLKAKWEINSYTLTVNPNGGTYDGKTTNSTYTQNYDTVKNIGIPTVDEYTLTFNENYGTNEVTTETLGKTFTGWTLTNGGQYVASSTFEENLSSGAKDFVDITKTIKTEDDETFENYTYKANSPSSNSWYFLRFPNYTYIENSTYEIRFKVRVNSISNAGNITFRHAAFSNDSGNTEGFVSYTADKVTNDWQDVVLSRTFTGTTIEQQTTVSSTRTIAPVFEAYSNNLINSTKEIDFDLKDIAIINKTTNALVQSNENLYWFTGDGTLTANYTDNSSITLPTPTRAGYTFDGWYDAESGGNKIGDAGETYTPSQDKTLYAHWTVNNYKVSYVGHGGTQLQNSNLVAKYDGLYNNYNSHDNVESWADLSSNNNGTIHNGTWGEDYLEFNGTDTWVDIGEINSDYNTLEVTFSTDSTEKQHILGNAQTGGVALIIIDGKIKAYYAINSIASGYQIVNSEINVEVGKKYHVVSTYDGTTIKLYVDGVLTNSIEVSGTIYGPDLSTIMIIGANPAGSIPEGDYFKGKIYNAAIYKSALTEEQIKNDSFKTVTYDASYGDLPTAARKGYTFNGWYTAITGGEEVESTTKVTTASDHNLYARWTPKTYTVTYDCNGGSNVPDDQTAVYGQTFTVTSDKCNRTGYLFNGWEDSTSTSWTDFSNTWTFDNGENGITDSTLTLKAKWTKDIKTYKVTYNSNGGKFSDETTQNLVSYDTNKVDVLKYSHTSNITDDGVRDGNYSSNLSTNDIVSIDGSESLHVKVTYATEKNYDYLYVFESEYTGEVTSNMSNGQLKTYSGGGNTLITEEFDIEGDTVTFSFYSDQASEYYGYYAEVTGIGTEAETTDTYKTPSYENATFDGWYTDENCTDGNEFKISKITSDIEVYAKWVYYITYETNGVQENPESIKIKVGSSLGTLPELVRRCYIFGGWSTSVDGSNIVTSETVPTKDLVLYSIFTFDTTTHKITYNANGGKFSDGSTINSIDQQCLETKYSHTSNIDDDGNQNNVYSKNLATNDVISLEGASKLYVTMKYATETDSDYIYVFNEEYTGEVTPNMSKGQIKTYSGNIFPAKTGVSNIIEESFVVESDRITISFYSSSKNKYDGRYGYYSKITKLPTAYKSPTYGNKTFDGWYTDENCTDGNEVVFDDISEDITLYAKWVYNITYISESTISGMIEAEDGFVIGWVDTYRYDGDNYIYTEKIKAGNSLSFPAQNNPSGKHFGGWSITKNSNVEIDENTIPTADMTLYPIWMYEIDYDATGGTVSPEYMYVYVGDSLGTLPTPEKDDYTFSGWYDSNDNQITSSTVPTANTTYYAKWTKDTVWAEELSYNRTSNNSAYYSDLNCLSAQCMLDIINEKLGGTSYKNGYYFGNNNTDVSTIKYSADYSDFVDENGHGLFIKIIDKVKYTCLYDSNYNLEPICFSPTDFNNSKTKAIEYFGSYNCSEYEDTSRNSIQCNDGEYSINMSTSSDGTYDSVSLSGWDTSCAVNIFTNNFSCYSN